MTAAETTPNRQDLSYAVLVKKRDSLTRDLPHGPEDLQWVTNTATLIFGQQDAILIDTFTTISQNAELVEWVASFGRNLTHVYTTHGHGDHFFGGQQLLERFPEAQLVATPGSVQKAREHVGPEWLDGFWKRLFPGDILNSPRVPDALDTPSLNIEGHELQILELGFTDTADTTAVWVPDLRLVVAGDIVYNHTHIFLAETDAETRRNWRSALETLRDLKPEVVVAGHKHLEKPDAPSDIDATIEYLDDVERLAGRISQPTELYDAILAQHPSRANPGSAWAASKALASGR